jgi:hypothetical protein
MAISRIGGRALKANLERDSNLAFNTTTLVVDYSNGRIGIGTASPSSTLNVIGNTAITSGTLALDQITIAGNKIESTVSNANLTLDANGTGTVDIRANTTIDGSITLQSGVAISSILDEDNLGSDSATALATQQSLKAYVDAQIAGVSPTGMTTTLSTPTDGSLVTDAMFKGFTSATKVTDAIDSINESLQNVLNSTAVSNVAFTSNITAGGAGSAATLTITADGNPNRYTVNWGDGTTDSNLTDSTPTHTYSSNTGSPFDVSVTAFNASGSGDGSTETTTRTDYITIFTANPVAQFDLFRASSGGSALTGNDLYVIEGQSLYMANTTTNMGSATANWTMNWGDGTSADTIATISAAGGTSGARLQHTWGSSTDSGTGRDTFTLTLAGHQTANPSILPVTGTQLVKVYDSAIGAPDALSTKTLPNVSSTGDNPKLAHGFTDNTGGAVLAAGADVNRVVSGTAVAGPITTFAYRADSGTLTANINGSADGAKAFSASDDSGTYTSLIIDSESDYNLLNAGGSTVSFASSIYHPALYTGFKARISKAVSGLSVGLNSMQLSHSTTGDSTKVEFVKDSLTSSRPSFGSVGTVAEGTAGTKRFISGIPYYNSGSPTVVVSGTTINDLVGQVYTNSSEIVRISGGTNHESTSSNVTSNNDYTYANIDGSTTMLSSGIPKVNTGTSSAYAIGNLTVPITSSSVRTIQRLQIRARNVNGVVSASDMNGKIQVHTAAQSGISEIAIAVADALGATYDDDGKRIFDLSAATTNTPAYSSSANFYTNSLYTEQSDPGVAGTKEATVRLGVIKHDVTDYSSGYLPTGPDRSGDTGTQYFTFAFRRTGVANFDINITSNGVTGVFIAAPGTGIDNSSGLNGWLDCSTTYGGSGQPGSDTGNGGNGSNGCAFTSGDRIAASTALSGGYTMTLGSENMSNARNNVVLVRIALASGQSVSALSIGEAA